MKSMLPLVPAILIALGLAACAPTVAFQKHLASDRGAGYDLYVGFHPVKRAPEGAPTKTLFEPVVTEGNKPDRLVFHTGLYIIAAQPSCDGEMKGPKILLRISDHADRSRKWLMELTPASQGISKGVFSVTRIEGVFLANKWDDNAKVPERNWPAPP